MAALAVSILAVATGVPTAGAQQPAFPYDELAGCLAGSDHLLVGVVLGELDAASAEVVADLVGRVGTGTATDVEVLVAGASPGYAPVTAWERFTPASAARFASYVRGVVSTSAGSDGEGAPFALAAGLAGLASDLADRRGELAADDVVPCELALVVIGGTLTDGDPAESLCEAGGPVGAIRGAGGQLAAIASGRAAEDSTGVPALLRAVAGDACGGSAAPPTRSFVAADAGALATEAARLMGQLRGTTATEAESPVCIDTTCAEGEHIVAIDATVGRFSVTVALPSATARLVVTPPRGVQFPVGDRADGPIGAGSFTIVADWITPEVVRLEATVSPLEIDWPGDWVFTVIDVDTDDLDPARFVSTFEPGLTPRFVGSPRLVGDRSMTVVAELIDASDRLVDASFDEVVELTATLRDAGGEILATAALAPNDIGQWRATLEPPPGLDAASGGLEVVLALTSASGPLSTEPVVAVAPVAVLSADSWPMLQSASVVVRGEPGGVLTGLLTVRGSFGVDGCVWLEGSSLTIAGSVVPVVLGDDARSAASCVAVPAESTVDIPVSVEVGEIDEGRIDAQLQVAVGARNDPSFDVDTVALTLLIEPPIDPVRRALITALATLMAMLIPLLALWVLDWVKARFRPARNTRAADVSVAVRSDGSIHRVDTDGSPLVVGGDLFSAADLPRARRFTWRDLEFRVRNAKSPFSAPVGTVGSSIAPVVASGGVILDEDTVVGRVPMNLVGSWIFVLEPEATKGAAHDPTTPDFYAAYGRLVLIAGPGDRTAVDLGDLPHMAQRLARTVRNARPGTAGTAQEMLDFVEVNVSTPRDLPRSSRHEEPGEEPAGEAVPELGPTGPTRDTYNFSDLADLFDVEPDDESDTVDDPVAADEMDDEEDESGIGEGVGIVFEERFNPSAFLADSDPIGSSFAPSPEEPAADARAPEPAVDEAPVADEPDPRLSWARRAKPSWPIPGRRKDR